MRKVHAGQRWKPPSAADENAVRAAAELLRRSPQNVDGGYEDDRQLDGCQITIYNGSGADRDRYDCLALGAHDLTTPDQYRRFLLGAAVTSPANPVAICQASIISGKWGPAQLAGVCWAYVDIDATSGLDHNRAIPKAADYQLQSAFAGPHRILWQPGSLSKQLCFVQLWARTSAAPSTYSRRRNSSGNNRWLWRLDDDHSRIRTVQNVLLG